MFFRAPHALGNVWGAGVHADLNVVVVEICTLHGRACAGAGRGGLGILDAAHGSEARPSFE